MYMPLKSRGAIVLYPLEHPPSPRPQHIDFISNTSQLVSKKLRSLNISHLHTLEINRGNCNGLPRTSPRSHHIDFMSNTNQPIFLKFNFSLYLHEGVLSKRSLFHTVIRIWLPSRPSCIFESFVNEHSQNEFGHQHKIIKDNPKLGWILLLDDLKYFVIGVHKSIKLIHKLCG